MASVQRKHTSSKTCGLCQKGDTVGNNKPHSLHKTKRTVKPNLQKKWGIMLCQNCFRTISKKNVKLS